MSPGLPWPNGDEARAVSRLGELCQLDQRMACGPMLAEVAGHGPFLFSGLQPSLRLKFVAATRLKSGVVALHYRAP